MTDTAAELSITAATVNDMQAALRLQAVTQLLSVAARLGDVDVITVPTTIHPETREVILVPEASTVRLLDGTVFEVAATAEGAGPRYEFTDEAATVVADMSDGGFQPFSPFSNDDDPEIQVESRLGLNLLPEESGVAIREAAPDQRAINAGICQELLGLLPVVAPLLASTKLNTIDMLAVYGDGRVGTMDFFSWGEMLFGPFNWDTSDTSVNSDEYDHSDDSGDSDESGEVSVEVWAEPDQTLTETDTSDTTDLTDASDLVADTTAKSTISATVDGDDDDDSGHVSPLLDR